MGKVEIIKMEESGKWDNIVRSFENYDVYYLSHYVRAFQIHGDGEPLLFYYDDGDTRAINVAMKRDIAKLEVFKDELPLNAYFDISTPYGYGGFIVEGEVTDEKLKELDKKYTMLCKKEGIISEFVRFHPVTNNLNIVSFIYDTSKLGRTVTMKLDSKKQIWDDLASKNRNVIRKAKRSGVEVYWGRSLELFEKFISMYNRTMNKADAQDYYYFEKDFYKSILSDLKYNSLIFYATYEGKIISMSIIMFSNSQMHYHLSASDMKYRNLASTNLLLYEAACWGSENGYDTFHLGGGVGSKEDGLFNFKKRFNKDSDTHFSIGRKIFDQEKYNKLVEIRRVKLENGINETYFLEYRG